MAKSKGNKITVSNPQKKLFGNSDITKEEFVNYYDNISKYMLPHLKGRPLALERFPEGITKQGFFQKVIPDYYPDYIERIITDEDSDAKAYGIVNDKEGLVYLASQAAITIHTWQSSKPDLLYPDQIVFDLDPSDDDLEKLAIGAKLVRYMFLDMGLDPFVKVTGQKGIHLVIPLKTEHTYEVIKPLTREIADFLSIKLPDVFTNSLSKAGRKGRIFLDYLRNQYGHTAAAPYSVRKIEGAKIAAPVTWDEIENDLDPARYDIRNIFDKLKRDGDPWKGFHKKPQSVETAIGKMKKLMKRKYPDE